MPSPSPRAFLRSLGKPERWCFTYHELKNPGSCKRDDEFVAVLPISEVGVVVLRDGTVTDRWEDGTVGVPRLAKQHANAAEVLWKPVYSGNNLAQNDQDEETHAWRDVLADQNGRFVRFMDARRAGQGLADSLIEGKAGDFIKSTLPPLPQAIRDLQSWGWQLSDIAERRTRFKLWLFGRGPENPDGFVAGGSMADNKVRFICSTQGDSVSAAIYDLVFWQHPIGVCTMSWDVMRPVMLIWHKTLFCPTGEVTADAVPMPSEWVRNWERLRADLEARNERPE